MFYAYKLVYLLVYIYLVINYYVYMYILVINYYVYIYKIFSLFIFY